MRNMLEFRNFFIERIKVENIEPLIPMLGDKLQATSEKCVQAVIFSALLSLRAHSRGMNKAKSLGGEFILRVAGTKQISEAIRKKGLQVGLNYLVFFGSKKEFLEILQKIEFNIVEPENCDEAKIKRKFEKAAILETF